MAKTISRIRLLGYGEWGGGLQSAPLLYPDSNLNAKPKKVFDSEMISCYIIMDPKRQTWMLSHITHTPKPINLYHVISFYLNVGKVF